MQFYRIYERLQVVNNALSFDQNSNENEGLDLIFVGGGVYTALVKDGGEQEGNPSSNRSSPWQILDCRICQRF